MLSIKTIFGAGWLVSSRLIGRLVDFVTLLVLARILSPADFGLTALAATLIAVIDTALELPLFDALTRLKAIDKSHLDTAFTLAVLRGGVLSVALLAAAWPFSLFYHDGRLPAIVCTLALAPVARALCSPAMVRFVRNVSFRQTFTTEVSGKILAAVVAVTLAKGGAGYWSVVANTTIASIMSTSLSYVIAPYRPAFSFKRIRDFSGFVGWLSLAQILAAVGWQVDRGFLGHFVSKATLGKYTVASDLSNVPAQSVIGPALQPVMAALARISDEGDRLAKAYLRATQYAVMLSAPACIGIALTADIVVKVLLGPQWHEAVFYLQWMGVAAALAGFYQPFTALAVAINRPAALFHRALIDFGCKIVIFPIGYSLYQLPGVLGARVLMSVLMFFVILFSIRKIIGISLVDQLMNLWRVAVACAAMGLVVDPVLHRLSKLNLPDFVTLFAAGALGATVYVGVLFGLGFRVREIMGARRAAQAPAGT